MSLNIDNNTLIMIAIGAAVMYFLFFRENFDCGAMKNANGITWEEVTDGKGTICALNCVDEKNKTRNHKTKVGTKWCTGTQPKTK